MKKPQGLDDLGSRLTQAAAAPLQNAPALRIAPPPKAPKASSIPVFVRVPAELHAELEAEATARTKATGRGVTVQQIILERCAGSR
jgi:hypothetical protein